MNISKTIQNKALLQNITLNPDSACKIVTLTAKANSKSTSKREMKQQNGTDAFLQHVIGVFTLYICGRVYIILMFLCFFFF